VWFLLSAFVCRRYGDRSRDGRGKSGIQSFWVCSIYLALSVRVVIIVMLILVNRILMATGFRMAVVYTYSEGGGGVSVEAEDECAVDFLKMRKVRIYERKKKVLTVRSLAKNGFFISR